MSDEARPVAMSDEARPVAMSDEARPVAMPPAAAAAPPAPPGPPLVAHCVALPFHVLVDYVRHTGKLPTCVRLELDEVLLEQARGGTWDFFML